MPDNLLGRMPHLFGRYSLPDVMSRLFHREHGDTPMTPTQYTGGLAGGSYTPSNFPLNAPSTSVNYTGGDPMTPSMTALNPGAGYTPPDWSSYLNAPDLTVKTGNGGGSAGAVGQPTGSTGGSTFSGNSSGGTLGGGYVVDPSQWGALGFGGDSGPVNGGIGSGYALQLMSGGMHEGGGVGGGLAGFMARPQTGGALPPQQGNTGIVPPNVLTGGGLAPQQAFAPQTGGGGQMQRQPIPGMPQNRLGGFGVAGYNAGMGGYLR
jgi:hypothetical protein